MVCIYRVTPRQVKVLSFNGCSIVCIYRVTPKQVKVLSFNDKVYSRILIKALLQVNLFEDFYFVFECVEEYRQCIWPMMYPS
jgi:hypothetical protein